MSSESTISSSSPPSPPPPLPPSSYRLIPGADYTYETLCRVRTEDDVSTEASAPTHVAGGNGTFTSLTTGYPRFDARPLGNASGAALGVEMVATIYGLDDAPSNDDQNNFVGEIVFQGLVAVNREGWVVWYYQLMGPTEGNPLQINVSSARDKEKITSHEEEGGGGVNDCARCVTRGRCEYKRAARPEPIFIAFVVVVVVRRRRHRRCLAPHPSPSSAPRRARRKSHRCPRRRRHSLVASLPWSSSSSSQVFEFLTKHEIALLADANKGSSQLLTIKTTEDNEIQQEYTVNCDGTASAYNALSHELRADVVDGDGVSNLITTAYNVKARRVASRRVAARGAHRARLLPRVVDTWVQGVASRYTRTPAWDAGVQRSCLQTALLAAGASRCNRGRAKRYVTRSSRPAPRFVWRLFPWQTYDYPGVPIESDGSLNNVSSWRTDNYTAFLGGTVSLWNRDDNSVTTMYDIFDYFNPKEDKVRSNSWSEGSISCQARSRVFAFVAAVAACRGCGCVAVFTLPPSLERPTSGRRRRDRGRQRAGLSSSSFL